MSTLPELNSRENNTAKKPNSVLGVITFLLLIAAVSLIAFAVYLKTLGYDFATLNAKDAIAFARNHYQGTASGGASEISFSKDGSADCKLYKNYILVLSQDGIKWYDKNGKLLQEQALTLAKPVLRSSGKYMAVIDISGRDIFFYKDKTQLWSRKLDNQIINADVSDDGYCTVVTQSKDYKSAVLVIDINGVDKYSKLCAEDIVIGAKAIHGGEDVLINKINTDGVKAGTQLEFHNVYEKESFSTITVKETLLPIVLSRGSNEVAVGQNLILFMDKQGKEIARKSAEAIFCVAPNGGKYVVATGKLSDGKGKAGQLVVVFNSSGEELYSFEQPENISGMHLYGDRLALRTQRSIYLYSIKGKMLGQYVSRNEIKDAYLIGDNEALVISGGSISRVEIK